MSKEGQEQLIGKARFWVPGICIICLGVLLDQWTKAMAVKYLKGTEGISLLPGILRLQYLENRGAAFGILNGRISLFLLLTGVITIGIFWVLCRMPRQRHYLLLNRLLFLMLAGALGNMIDRGRLGYVIDFIYVSLIDFPIFNAADVFAVAACILLIFVSFTVYRDEHDFDFLVSERKD